ncbi:AraC family transcriptional regulator [Chitinophaga varians]|uniref:AraC family transcriptional regulator n=1 Tax=Chitinophaga varians TaxID=2202339 RepID=A0A847RCW0_9BACT|nr:helix-turn-helix domain-containing protein [Chitinophaga varians]NLR63890.1 AraC family transcriptional regulator [Chitinophaga varians]
MFKVQTFRPHQRLGDYLLSWQLITGDFPPNEVRYLTVLPHFIQSMWFNTGPDNTLYDVIRQKYLSSAVLTGPRSRVSEWRVSGNMRLLAAHFRPGSWLKLFNSSAQLFCDRCIDMTALFGHTVTALLSNINASGHPRQQVQLLEAWLLEQLTGTPKNSCNLENAMQLILAASGNITIRQLEAQAFLTKRTLERAFLEQTGLHLKLFCRLVRFRKTIDYMTRMRYPQWKLLAHKAGYCDQTHFINEFRYFTHRLPHQFSDFLPQQPTDFVTFI